MSRRNRTRNVAVIAILAFLSVSGTGIYFVSAAWSEFTSAELALSEASSEVDWEQNQLDEAQAALRSSERDYQDWLTCWLGTSYAWDWICGSEYLLTAAVDSAQATVDSATHQLGNAQLEFSKAQTRVDDAAESANLSSIAWGIGSGVLLLAAIILGTLALRRRAIDRKTEADNTKPDWDCLSCSTHNAGGMFCINCGQTKNTENSTQGTPDELVPIANSSAIEDLTSAESAQGGEN